VDDSVRADWIEWSAQFESEPNAPLLDYFYRDALGFVSIGLGNLVDPYALLTAANLVFVRPDGEVASPSEVSLAWLVVRQDKTLDPRDGGASYRHLTTIRATQDSLRDLVLAKLDAFDEVMSHTFPTRWSTFPPAAQRACLSMCWAVGPGWPHIFPLMGAALACEAWDVAARESRIARPVTDSLTRRNAAVRALLLSCNVQQ
jgi:hypothetical protein